jgi:hypothetical protein
LGERESPCGCDYYNTDISDVGEVVVVGGGDGMNHVPSFDIDIDDTVVVVVVVTTTFYR